jgi:CDP-diacylglycerol--serine O-phosphatidyltransferase
MSIKQHIPNALTLLNLFCGVCAIIFCLYNHYYLVPFFVLISLIADFLDGFVARALKVKSDLGAQLDSLADMTTFGVLPSLMLFMLLQFINREGNLYFSFNKMAGNVEMIFPAVSLIALVYAVFACIRLAKFNIDTRQTVNFIGVPTPAAAMFVLGLYTAFTFNHGKVSPLIFNSYVLIAIVFLLSWLMVAELPLFSLKGNPLNYKQHKIRFIFLILCLPQIFIFKWLSLSTIIVSYILFSTLNNLFPKTNAQN